MECYDVKCAVAEIKKYLKNSVPTPFFVVVDDYNQYLDLYHSIKHMFVKELSISDYCNVDSYPDYDLLVDDLNNTKDKCLLIGLGEAIYLDCRIDVLRQFKDYFFDCKLVVICRKVSKQIRKIVQEDPKFNDGRRLCYIRHDLGGDLLDDELIQIAKNIDAQVDCKGIKELLSKAATNPRERTTFTSGIIHKQCTYFECAFDLVKDKNPELSLERKFLSDSQWIEFLENPEVDSDDIGSWRFYINEKLFPKATNIFVQYCIQTSDSYEEYSHMLHNGLICFDCDDPDFPRFYEAWKKLSSNFDGETIANYINSVIKHVPDETKHYCYLTDNTDIEKKNMLEIFGRLHFVPDSLETLFPLLGDYLRDYYFTCYRGDELTEYFRDYKYGKVVNEIPLDFENKVSSYATAGNRPYNELSTRGILLEKFDTGRERLYWIDALGVEYLGYIQKKANDKGLNVQIAVGKAELPTLTAFNKDFYATWPEDRKIKKINQLDDIKHEGDKNFLSSKGVPYLIEELKVIDTVLCDISRMLNNGDTKSCILTSDHGASRFAVLHETDHKLAMREQGQHSGRCCPVSDFDDTPEYAIKENGYWALANYDRFKGGRKADCEVHGGASLEEILVPVIKFTLKNKNIVVECKTKITYSDNWKTVPKIELYCHEAITNLSLLFNGNMYSASKSQNSGYIYIVEFNDFRTAGVYNADVYADDNYVCTIKFEIRRKSGSVNKEQDDFFK